MRELNPREVSFISGGVDGPLLVGIASGYWQASFYGTMLFSALFDGFMGMALFVEKLGKPYRWWGLPFGAGVGMLLGSVGYRVGQYLGQPHTIQN
jgi:hypothetical protein